jgi:hypothetical protein
MSRATLFAVTTMLSAGALCACTSFRPHAHTGTGSKGGMFEPRRPGSTPEGGDIGGRRIPVGAPTAVAGRSTGGVRRVCRTGSRPSGWIAVAYVSAEEGDCPALARSDSSATAAVLTYYADLPLEAGLDVCADEPVPSGWAIDDTVADASESCPGAKKRNGSTTYHMRRVR